MAPVVSVGQARPFILLPLYIYPSAGSWDPFYSAARSHPKLEFIVIVNPDNGPGCSPAPDYNYMMGLLELSSLPNVKVLGYVYCSYGERAVTEVEYDIQIYRGWVGQRFSLPDPRQLESDDSTLASRQPIRIDGIFFDEVPSEHQYVDHMAAISNIAKTTPKGVDTDTPAPALVIFNPGIFVEPAFYDLADYIVVFENAAVEWDTDYVRINLNGLPVGLRQRSVAIAHSEGCVEQQLRFGREVVATAGFAGHFATAMPGYTLFCSNWEAYVRHANETWMETRQDSM